MLIHIGQNDFVSLKKCEFILNLQTIDESSRKSILSQLQSNDGISEYKSAIKTTDGKWYGSTLSSEALAQRGIGHSFVHPAYLREDLQKDSFYNNQGVI